MPHESNTTIPGVSTTNNHCKHLNHCNDGASTTNNSSGSLTPVRRHITTEGRENDEKQSLQSPTTFQYKSPEDDGEGKLVHMICTFL